MVIYANERECKTQGNHLAISADGKGIRIIKSERDKRAQKQTPKVRLGKGERPGLKKEAVVTADFSFNPVPRSPEEIVQSGMRWTITGATSILKQRAVKLNGDWNTFWEHHMNSQRATLYPDSYKIAP